MALLNEMKLFENSLYELSAKLNLIGEKCALKHAPSTADVEVLPAVDYLCQNLGQDGTTIRIPICINCANALYDQDWLLIFCISCCCSQWVYKPMARNMYEDDVIWLYSCPECKSERGTIS